MGGTAVIADEERGVADNVLKFDQAQAAGEVDALRARNFRGKRSCIALLRRPAHHHGRYAEPRDELSGDYRELLDAQFFNRTPLPGASTK